MTTGLRKGRAVAILWADLPAARRGDLETWATGEALAPADPGTGVLAVGRYAGISGGPAFIEVHELSNDDAAVVAASARLMAPTLRALERLEATVWPGGAATESGGPRPAGEPGGCLRPDLPARDRRAGGHPRAAARAPDRAHRHPARARGRIQRVVQHRLSDRKHVGERRVRGAPLPEPRSGPRYLTIYELAHAEVSRQPAWDRARAQSIWRRRIERLWTHAPGSPGIYRRLAAR